jgi:Ca2+-binding RTX toxin-like protein
MDQFDLGLLSYGSVTSKSSTSFTVAVGDDVTFTGTNLTYGANGLPTGGVITAIQDSYQGATVFTMQGLNVAASDLSTWIATGANATAKAAMFAGSDTMTGGGQADQLRAYGGNDSIAGGGGNDTLDGGAGDDTLAGGAGADVIITGGGHDVIVVGQGETSTVSGGADVITDWNASDVIRFAHAPVQASEFATGTAADYNSALAYANGLIAAGTVNVVAVAVGADVVVFADSAGDNGVADDAVVLSGRTLADVGGVNFGVTSLAAPTGLKLDAATDSGTKGDGITNIAQVKIDGVATKGATITLFDGTKVLGTATADATSGAFVVQAGAPLATGAHTLGVQASDAAGHTSSIATTTVTIDTQVGTAVITGVTDFTSGGKTNVTLNGTDADPSSTVAVYEDGVSIGSVQPANGAWSFTASSVSNAAHAFTVKTTDVAGNVAAGPATVLYGSSNAEKLVGAATNDFIEGGHGADTLTGGAGSDVFVYGSITDAPLATGKNAAVEVITDFQDGVDTLDLTRLGHMTYGAQTSLGPHEVVWYVSGGNTFISGDVTGNTKADFAIELLGVHTLSPGSFLLA